MKVLLSIATLVLIVSCASHHKKTSGDPNDENTSPLKFNGVYRTSTDNSNYHYFRFFDDGTVIDILSNGTPSQIKEWFDKTAENAAKGKYELDGKNISFSTKDQSGKVDYDGKINSDGTMSLSGNSHITGTKFDYDLEFVTIKDWEE